MMKIFVFFLIPSFFLLPIQQVEATTSCAGAQTILGFTPDWKQMYWDEEKSGECSPGNAVQVFNFEERQWSLIQAFDWVDAPGKKKEYQTLLHNLRNKTQLPKNTTAKGFAKQCDFSKAVALPKDPYLTGVKTVHRVYFNPKFQQWVIVSNECNLGDSVASGGHCRYNAIYILPKQGCPNL
ncbi:MAG: hypothetical protein HYU97_05590 [Deltaproteobacteria bacterium]|nr:hypothetical protein [Deltaproteobacteria bacterium]